jgi:hypothetical protein
LRIRISIGNGSGSKKAETSNKNRKIKEMSCFEVLDVLFSGLKVSPVASWRPRIKKIEIFDQK